MRVTQTDTRAPERPHLRGFADLCAAFVGRQLTKSFLRHLSSATAECIDCYTGIEIERTGARELRTVSRQWRSFVA